MKTRYIILGGLVLGLGACNSVYVKPNSMEPGTNVYARYGGYSMRRSIKKSLEDRNFRVAVNAKLTNKELVFEDNDAQAIFSTIPNDATYLVRVTERRELFMPLCALNGFWWWNFNVSISNRATGEELLAWRGRGCADSSVRRLNRILDKMEKKDDQ